jgi:orotate phosphoribosyltransferase
MKKILLQNQKVIDRFNEVKNFYLMGPYTTTNNCVMPLYVDARGVFSHPQCLKGIASEMIKFIKKEKIKFDFIIGGATAGIPIATAVGVLMNKPVGYVRKAPKGGGTNRVVEGDFKKGSTALLIDDALGHGAGKTVFLSHIRKSGYKINWLLVTCSRGYNNPDYFEWFKAAKVNFASFADLSGIIKDAGKRKLISPQAVQLLVWYFENASGWQKDKKKWHYFLEYKKIKKHQSRFGV